MSVIQQRKRRSGMGMQVDSGSPVKTRVLVVDADEALFDLIEEWLAPAGHRVVAQNAANARAKGGVDLIVVDVPFPRQGGLGRLQRIALEHPGTPMLALSSTFFPGVGSNGAVARALGVAGVLPKPVKREALVAAVEELANSRK